MTLVDSSCAAPARTTVPPVPKTLTEACCKACERVLAIDAFYPSVYRGFRFCRACCTLGSKQRRQRDPAVKLLSRARAAERRRKARLSGFRVEAVRRMIADLDEPALIEADRVRLVRRFEDEALSEDNAELVILEQEEEGAPAAMGRRGRGSSCGTCDAA